MSEQKFQRGDFVQIAKDLGSMMSHFEADCRALVMYSYAEKYGGSDTASYCLWIENGGEVAWYQEHRLTLIEAGRTDLIDQWERDKQIRITQESGLDWIFSPACEQLSGTTIEALAKEMGITDLWGPNGEGITYVTSSHQIVAFAWEYFATHDKAGFLEAAHAFRERTTSPNRDSTPMTKPDIQFISTQLDDGNYNVEIVITGAQEQVQEIRADLEARIQEKGITISERIGPSKIN